MTKKSICDDCSKDCVWRAPSNGLDPPVINCREFVPKPITNYHRLISKTPEELAEWLVFVEQRILELQPMLERPALYADWLNWLRQESESGG